MSQGDRDFEELKTYWYQKLKESGFEDIETPYGCFKDSPERRLRRDYTPDRFQEKQEYYRLASQLLFDHSFRSSFDKKVWGLHTEGFSLREIAMQLRTPSNQINKDNIQKTIARYAKIIRGKLFLAEE